MTAAATSSEQTTELKPWIRPEATPLPVEETATNGSTGNDGTGPTSHS